LKRVVDEGDEEKGNDGKIEEDDTGKRDSWSNRGYRSSGWITSSSLET
jgi:hypothetical protein